MRKGPHWRVGVSTRGGVGVVARRGVGNEALARRGALRRAPRCALALELAVLPGVSLGGAAFGGRGLSPARRGVVGAGAILVVAATALLIATDWTLTCPVHAASPGVGRVPDR